MISLYKTTNTEFTKNGDVFLTPTKCTVKIVAAGQYDLTMDHPIDPDGKWAFLQPEAIIAAPIPAELKIGRAHV